MNIIQLLEALALPPEKQRTNADINIFKNPTSKELNDVIKADEYDEFRFAIDRRKGKNAVYVWPSNLTHADAAHKLGLPYPDIEMMYGIGKKYKDKLEAYDAVTSKDYKERYIYYISYMRNITKNDKLYKSAKKEYEITKLDWQKHVSKNWKNKWIDVEKIVSALKDIPKDDEEYG